MRGNELSNNAARTKHPANKPAPRHGRYPRQPSGAGDPESPTQAKVGELEIHVSHHLEDLVHARAERDRFEADSKNAAEKIIALSDELSDLRAQHDMLKKTVGSQVVDRKRKREEDEGLGPAFREYNIMPDAESDRGSAQPWNSPKLTFGDPGSILCVAMHPTPPSVLLFCDPHFLIPHTRDPRLRLRPLLRNLPIPGLQADFQASGVHSTPWSQHAASYSVQSSPMSTRSNTATPYTIDSQRTTDPRKRIKVDSTQTTPSAQFATPTRSAANKEQHLARPMLRAIDLSPSVSAGRSPPTGPRCSAYKRTPSQILARVPEMPPTPSPTRKHVPSLPSNPRRASLRARSMASKHELEAGELEPEITSH
ncbi:hypothetical protein B0H10DRAFT_2442442 [Mycena sp. CBHHK59/15]|nr:hypothetical protein B0H10DRAFT_2442442 [Mycena sp. CBHHK59/15]